MFLPLITVELKQKKYLEAGLTIEKIDGLYKEKGEKEKKSYVKSSYYCYIFSTSFNINFGIPKPDRLKIARELK